MLSTAMFEKNGMGTEMHRELGLKLMVLILACGRLSAVHAIEYNEPQPPQKFAGSGWLIDSGNDHGVEFKSFLESKRLVVAPDAIYYAGSNRIETTEQGTPGKINWDFRARCAVRPDLVGKMPVGIYTSSKGIHPTEQFTEVNPTASSAPDNASRGWYTLWWAACKGAARKF